MSCDHPKEQLELRRKRGIGWTYRDQCLECGVAVSPPKPVSRIESPGQVPMWDWSLPRSREKRPNSKRRSYEAELRSPRWKKLRRLVLERDSYICRLQLDDACTVEATTIEHLHYRTFGRERPSDLVAACNTCNLESRRRRVAA